VVQPVHRHLLLPRLSSSLPLPITANATTALVDGHIKDLHLNHLPPATNTSASSGGGRRRRSRKWCNRLHQIISSAGDRSYSGELRRRPLRQPEVTVVVSSSPAINGGRCRARKRERTRAAEKIAGEEEER
jgi:hypothetical protein